MLTIYVVDFAINAGWCSARTEQADFTADAKVQSSLRVEVLLSILYRLQSSNSVLLGVRLASPIREYTHIDFLQASRMIAIGHLIGYGAGTLDLVSIIGPILGDTQFKQLTVIAAFAFLFAIAITSWAVEERVLISAR